MQHPPRQANVDLPRYSPLSNRLDGRLVAVAPTHTFTQPTATHDTPHHIPWLILGVAWLGAAGLIYWISRRITQPVAQLSQAVKEVAQGDRQEIVTPQPTRELTELTNSVNYLANRLRRSLTDLSTANQELSTREQRLQQILEALPVGVIMLAPNGKCLYVNQTGQLLLGRSMLPQVELNQLPAAYHLYHSETDRLYPWDRLPIVQALHGKAVYADNLEVRLKNTTIPLEAQALPVTDAAGKVIYAIQTFQNITLRKRAEAAKQQSEQRLQTLMDNVPGMIFRYVIDARNREQFTYVSPHAVDLFEIDATAIQQDPQRFWSLILPEDEVAIRQPLAKQHQTAQPWSVEYRIRTPSGQIKWMQTRATLDHSIAGSTIWDGVDVDITDRKQAETILQNYRQHLEQQVQARTFALQQANQALDRLATLDGLTQIANRRRFDRYLKQEWHRIARDQQPLSLILCDIDYFKRYNDCYGHQQGDACLQQVVKAMQNVIKRPADLLARYGGEEFAVILPQTNRWGAGQVAKSLHAATQQLHLPHRIYPSVIAFVFSVGVATVTVNTKMVILRV